MSAAVVTLITSLALAAAALWFLVHRQGHELPPAPARGSRSWGRLLLQSCALTIAVLYAAAQGWHASAGLAPSARWWLWSAAAVLLLPFLANHLAGIWFLLRLGPRGLDCSLTVLGHSGRLREVGLTRITLVENEGRVVLLPHLPLAWQPLAVAPPAATAVSRILFERECWSDEQRRFLLQAAILSPYRDVTCPVSVSVTGRVATVDITLLRPEALELLERFLQRSMDEQAGTRSEISATAPSSAPPRQR